MQLQAAALEVDATALLTDAERTQLIGLLQKVYLPAPKGTSP